MVPKTADEVAAVKTTLRAARSALRGAVRAAGPGEPVAALIAAFAESSGGCFPLGEGFVWRIGSPFVRLAATDVLGAGDVVALELGLSHAAYAGVAGDTVAVGGGDLMAARRAWFAVLCAIAGRWRTPATPAPGPRPRRRSAMPPAPWWATGRVASRRRGRSRAS